MSTKNYLLKKIQEAQKHTDPTDPDSDMDPQHWELICNVKIVYGNLKSENSQDYARKHQRNCTFMNSASALFDTSLYLLSCQPSSKIYLNFPVEKP
jgi:hypothetical protein